jgi:hypothetical protein
MSNRSTKFVPAIFAGILAGANFTAVAENSTKEADSCLSGPKGDVPAGSHWYYRIDRATKRHCWYIGEEREKTARAAPQDLSPSANRASPQKSASVRKSIADAHAEWPSPQARVEQDANVTAEQKPDPAAGAPVIENSQRAAMPDAGSQTSLIASRWPDSSGVSSSSNPPPAATRLAAASPPSEETAPETAPSPDVTPVALAAADSAPEKQPGAIQMLLLVMIGALALAGLIGSVIFRFSRARAARRKIRGSRRVIWDQVDLDRSSRQLFPADDAPGRNVDRSHAPRVLDNPDARIEEMLARLARSTQT